LSLEKQMEGSSATFVSNDATPHSCCVLVVRM
jgi:hypothetical protein